MSQRPSTTDQKVDSEKYGRNYERIFGQHHCQWTMCCRTDCVACYPPKKPQG